MPNTPKPYPGPSFKTPANSLLTASCTAQAMLRSPSETQEIQKKQGDKFFVPSPNSQPQS